MSAQPEDAAGNVAFKRARWAANWTQEELAERFEAQARALGMNLALSARQVRRWESAAPPWPHAPYRSVLEELFGCPAEQLGFRPPRRGPQGANTGPDLPTLRATRTPPSQEDEPVYRREFLRATGAALAPGARAADAADRIGNCLLLRSALPATAEPISTSALRRAVDQAKSAYQGCHYARLTRQLPGLVAAAETCVRTAPDTERRAVCALQAESLHVTASMLLKLGRRDLALISADRALSAAERSSDPLAVAGATRILAHATFAAGHPKTAAALVIDTAQRLDDPSRYGAPDYQSVYGALLLRGALAAAHDGDRDGTATLLDEADAMATRLGADANHRWTAFGPTNVALHRVATAVELGDAGHAIAAARTVRWEAIDVVERQAALWVDLARAFGQWRKDDEALRALLAAERLAPEEVRTLPAVRVLVEEVWFRQRRAPSRDLLALARRTGAGASL